MNIKQYFEKNRYIYLENVITKKKAAQLTDRIWSLKEQGKLIKDVQCPKSWSIYGDPELDNILEQLTKPLSQQLGIELLPTYTYCRLYEPGEVLKRHTDRESCEISATMTLGHDEESEIWPIFMTSDPEDIAGQQFVIGVGDVVVYRGNELTHWRPAYRGRWQIQVFFHFVDTNGPHSQWAFDKRESLGIDKSNMKTKEETSYLDNFFKKPHQKKSTETEKQTEIKARDPIYNSVMIPSWDRECPGYATFNKNFNSKFTFTKNECKNIIEYAQNKYPEKARVGAEVSGKFNSEVRRVEQYQIELNNDTKWIFDHIAKTASKANAEYYGFDLMGITHPLYLLHYKDTDNSFYDWHTDIGPGDAATRKLSMVCMLSPEDSYEGGDLIINNFGNEILSVKEQGSINMFPSFLLHTVTPVTIGERWVLVSWIHGGNRFK